MTEPLIRGYVVQYTADFFRTQCDPDLALRIDRELPIELRSALAELVPSSWVPRQYQTQLLHAVAAAHGNAEATRTDLVRCGAGLANMDNHFMELLMKLLTPELLLRKSPLFWSRDHRDSGCCELEQLDADRRAARLRLRGVAGYEHASLLWLGWLRRMLEQLSPNTCEITQQGWTWSSPSPDEVSYEIRWS